MKLRDVHIHFLVFLATVSAALAQTAGPTRTPPSSNFAEASAAVPATYGTASETAIALSQWKFHPWTSTTTFDFNNGKYSNVVDGYFLADLQLPAGAQITRVVVQACNSNATVFGQLILSKTANNTGYGGGLAVVSIVPNSGCSLTTSTLSPAHTVDNESYSYNLQWTNGAATDGSVVLQAVRVYYKLQVSPPPGTATFADVPTTHLFYQYIEALAASGITSGCGGGNFCPDAAVTRGQMAVFLAKALGLHWAP
jgi:S-layer family protein